MKKKSNKIKQIGKAFMHGLKGADDLLFNSANDGVEIVVNKEQTGRLSEALLQGEVTQEVLDLRYRTYKIIEESTNYDVVGGLVAFKNTKNKPLVDEVENGCKVLLVQHNKRLTSTFKDSENMQNQFFFNIKRDFNPRFLLEKYCDKIVLKMIKDNYQLDFYTSIYKEPDDMTLNIFTSEVEKIVNNKLHRSELIDFNEISFRASDAYGVVNDSFFKFKINKFITASEFKYYDNKKLMNVKSGFYVLKFNITPLIMEAKLTEDFYNKELEEKYQKKEAKTIKTPLKVDFLSDGNYKLNTDTTYDESKCEVCGNDIGYFYNEDGTKLIDEETNQPMFDELAFADFRITKFDFGCGMCVKCLENKLLENK